MAEIILHEDYRAIFGKMTREQVGEIVLAMMDYAGGKEPAFDDPVADMAFTCLKSRIDYDTAKYDRVTEQRREAGRKSAEARKRAQEPEQQATDVNESQRPLTTVNERPTPLNEKERASTISISNININNKSKRESNKEKSAPESTRFRKPTVEEVAAYCRERGNSLSAQGFVNYYEANGWKVGRNPMKDWKAAVRTWEARDKKTVAPGQPRNKFHNFEQRTNDLDKFAEALAD